VLTRLLDYPLPADRIAQRPLAAREDARLLVLGSRAIEHRSIADWPSLVPRGSLVVVNDSRVIRARLLGRRRGSGGRVEVLLLEPVGGAAVETARRWVALGRANRPLRVGTEVEVGALRVTVEGRDDAGTLTVHLDSAEPIAVALAREGSVPIPPYIRRPPDEHDGERYQTVYASVPGSVAAPTAGLHLTAAARTALADRDVRWASVTLHVGLGTFRPVEVPNLDEHPMHDESVIVGEPVVRAVAETRRAGGAVIAVGTTVVRALESARDPHRPGHVVPLSGRTRLLIQPGYSFGVVDALLTNFHQPRSTLLALVGAFAGLDRVREGYQAALDAGYRFLSYGDAMWIPERAC
jgi:S-adenosylmethionine:tRNA ribosyltransferase-isomerase